MATATISFIDTIYWSSGDGIAGVTFTKTDYLGLNPEVAFIDFVHEESGESSILTYNLSWPSQVQNGDIITFVYDGLAGEYTDSLGNPIQGTTIELANCKGYGGLPTAFEGGWFNGDEAMLESYTPGLPNSRYLTISYWYHSEIGEPLENRAFISTSSASESGRPSYVGEAVSVTTNVLKKLIIRVEGETGLETVYAKSVEALPDEDGTPHNLLIAIDSKYPGTSPAVHAWIDDTELTLDINSYIAAGEPMKLSEPYWQMGLQGATPDNKMLGCVDHVYVVNEFLAIKYQGVRDLFHNASMEPITLGDTGEWPTGNQAWIYCTGFAVPFLVNKGAAPDFYAIGRWQDCGTPPLPPPYETEVLADTPVLYLQMNSAGTMGDNTAPVLDAEDATIVTVDPVSSPVQGGSQYDGINVDPDKTYIQGPGYPSIANLGNLVGGDDATFECLLYLDPTFEGTSQFIMGKGPQSTGNGSYPGWYIFLSSDGHFYIIAHYGQYAAYQKCLMKPIYGEWFHFAFVAKKQAGTDWEFSKWWIDGVAFDTEILGEGPGGSTMFDNALPYRVGIRIRETDGVSDIPLKGYVDEVAWYDYELPEARIVAHYETSSIAPKPPRIVTSVGDQADIQDIAIPFTIDVTLGVYPGSGTPVVYTVANLPDGLLFDGQFITGTPTVAGTYNTEITCSTGVLPDAVDSITWEVEPPLPAYSALIVADDPVAYFRHETGRLTRNYSTRANAVDATSANNLPTTTGVIGTAGVYNGVNSYIETPNYSDIQDLGLNKYHTVEAIVRISSSATGHPMLISKGPGGLVGSVAGWYLGYRDSEGRMVMHSNVRGRFTTVSTTAVPLDTWFHVVMGCRWSSISATAVCYINGVSYPITVEATAGGSTSDWNLELRTGLRIDESTDIIYNPLLGNVDEISVWDRVLTPTEVANHFALTGL